MSNEIQGLKKKFLKLPVKKYYKNAPYTTDSFFSLRKLTYFDIIPPILAICISTEKKYIICSEPITDVSYMFVKKSQEFFENSAKIIYQGFLEFVETNSYILENQEPFRPELIMVDNPLFAEYLSNELKGSGTFIEYVNDHSYVTKDGTPVLASINAVAFYMNSIRGGVLDSYPDPKIIKVKNGYILDEKDKYPNKMVSCCNIQCQLLDVNMKKCSKCKLKYYCSVECQKLDWEEHRKICKEK